MNRKRSKGEIIDGGYIYIKYPGHHRAKRHQGNYVKRADLVAEKKEDRVLEQNEIVHHINGIRDDDRPENLRVMSKTEHARLHQSGSSHSQFRHDLITEKTQKEIRELYRNGISYKKIGMMFECSAPTIQSFIPVSEQRGRGLGLGKENPNFIDFGINEAKRLRETGLSYEKIGKILGVSRGTIRNRLAKKEGN